MAGLLKVWQTIFLTPRFFDTDDTPFFPLDAVKWPGLRGLVEPPVLNHSVVAALRVQRGRHDLRGVSATTPLACIDRACDLRPFRQEARELRRLPATSLVQIVCRFVVPAG